jgi:hypothetical protein
MNWQILDLSNVKNDGNFKNGPVEEPQKEP